MLVSAFWGNLVINKKFIEKFKYPCRMYISENIFSDRKSQNHSFIIHLKIRHKGERHVIRSDTLLLHNSTLAFDCSFLKAFSTHITKKVSL